MESKFALYRCESKVFEMRAKNSSRILEALDGLALASLACSLDDILFPKTFYVTKTADTADGECTAADCSLREAFIASNETVGHTANHHYCDVEAA